MISRRGFFAILSGIGSATAITGSSVSTALAIEPSANSASSLPAGVGLDPFRVAGRVRWYDALEGYGFVTPDDCGADILLHVTCLRAGGYQTAHEGARVDCLALRRPKGMQVFRILSMDDSAAIDPSSLRQRRHAGVQPQSGWERASVKWFNRVRGFGFLTRGKDTSDIFVHLQTVQNARLPELRPGQMVQVRWGMGAKGVTAAELRPDWLLSTSGLSI